MNTNTNRTNKTRDMMYISIMTAIIAICSGFPFQALFPSRYRHWVYLLQSVF